ncbi:MAG TPA: hypothetical protein VFG12_16345, partial [Rhodopila sp.]|nr:hypothetical protein [Rhodopila sp.]
QNHPARQDARNPVRRQNARQPPPEIPPQPLGIANVVIMDKQDNKTADDEEQINTSVAELKQGFKPRQSEGLIKMSRNMVNHHRRRGTTPARLDPTQPCRFSRFHTGTPSLSQMKKI